MRRRLVYLRRAQQDLVEIQDYIARDSPARARAWLAKLDAALARLAEFPESGAVPGDQRLASRGYRMVVIGEHLVFYALRGPRVEIRRVVHGRRRYEFLLA